MASSSGSLPSTVLPSEPVDPSRATTETAPPTGTRSSSPSANPTSAGADAGRTKTRVAQQLADRLTKAAKQRDAAGWRRQVHAPDQRFADTAAMIYRNLSSIRPTELRFTATGRQQPLTPQRRTTLGAEAFAAQVLVSWALPEQAETSEQVVWMTLVPAAGEWRWAGVDDGPVTLKPASLPLWWFEPVVVQRGDGSVVLAGPGVDAARWLARATAAVGKVRSRLEATTPGVPAADQGWTGHLVLVLPSTEQAFERVVGARPGSESQLAALTVPDAMNARTAPMRIVFNPAVTARQDELGLNIVLTHEATHAATRSPASAAPLWLVEGFADYVAYASYPQAQKAATDELYRQIRETGPPAGLPSNQRFSASATHLELAYAEAWLAILNLAGHGGAAKVNAFYSRVSRSADGNVETALQKTYGYGQTRLVEQWRTALTTAARG